MFSPHNQSASERKRQCDSYYWKNRILLFEWIANNNCLSQYYIITRPIRVVNKSLNIILLLKHAPPGRRFSYTIIQYTKAILFLRMHIIWRNFYVDFLKLTTNFAPHHRAIRGATLRKNNCRRITTVTSVKCLCNIILMLSAWIFLQYTIRKWHVREFM